LRARCESGELSAPVRAGMDMALALLRTLLIERF
jgi:hypothetical protein